MNFSVLLFIIINCNLIWHNPLHLLVARFTKWMVIIIGQIVDIIISPIKNKSVAYHRECYCIYVCKYTVFRCILYLLGLVQLKACWFCASCACTFYVRLLTLVGLWSPSVLQCWTFSGQKQPRRENGSCTLCKSAMEERILFTAHHQRL